MLLKADEYDLSSREINLRDNQEIPKNLDSPIDWLIENGYKEVAFESTKAHVFFSLLTDFIFYMHESLSCSERGKVTVAFSNSRKPIKDNLFYICWLLVNSEELISKLMNDNPKTFDVSALNYEFKVKILNEAVKKVNFPLDGKLLVEIIYDRKSPRGLSSIWDKTLHIITSNKRYPTSVGNLNFIFADEDIWNEHWETYYDKITHIMTFATDVSIPLFEDVAKVDGDTKLFNKIMRNIKYDLTYSDDFIQDSYKDIFDHLSFTCEECTHNFVLDEKLIKEFISDYLFTCPNCNSIERVGQYYFSNID